MKNNITETEFDIILDESILTRFKQVAVNNGTTASEVLTDFVKDYVVSNGHPELVINRWPWNKKN